MSVCPEERQEGCGVRESTDPRNMDVKGDGHDDRGFITILNKGGEEIQKTSLLNSSPRRDW